MGHHTAPDSATTSVSGTPLPHPRIQISNKDKSKGGGGHAAVAARDHWEIDFSHKESAQTARSSDVLCGHTQKQLMFLIYTQFTVFICKLLGW
jgi:hypothetical protein